MWHGIPHLLDCSCGQVFLDNVISLMVVVAKRSIMVDVLVWHGELCEGVVLVWVVSLQLIGNMETINQQSVASFNSRMQAMECYKPALRD